MSRPKPTNEIAAAVNPSEAASNGDFSGQRRLVRPNLSMRSLANRQSALYGHGPTLTSRSVAGASPQDSSHAEVFYFQKQIQAQTRMVVVLENGQQLEGIVEWYDRYAIKLRNVGGDQENHGTGRHRVLVYKDSIRYIYKAEDNAPQTMT